ncbi:AAA family ATPase [Poseidonibacter sp.]|uniref:AAA family ATPase n=1 Tax=Poseidonibacter sp. TaxID=2321188 RepID=UPI003C70DBE9
MKIDAFQEKQEIIKEKSSVSEQIFEMLELFTDLANMPYISYYTYDYEYNDFFYEFSIDNNGKKIDAPSGELKKYKILLKRKNIIFGYVLIYKKIKSNPILHKLLLKINKHLEKQRELKRKLMGNDISFNIYLIHDEDLAMFAKNMKSGLEGLFNVEITMGTSIKKYSHEIKSKDTKHIILYLINDQEKIESQEKYIKYLNELIIVIGPNDHHTSMYCGRLGIQNYIPINEFRAEDIKSIIINTRNNLMQKNKFGNKIIGINGISGGIGTTTIAMNMADLLATNLPNKNILYIDLATTKAISNLFLEKNPLPEKTIIDLINTNEFNIEKNLEHGLIKKSENFYCITGIQKHIDKEFLEKDIFIEKLLEYISAASDDFNFIIIDIGISDASNLKSTIYDVVNELWLVTEMTLPHISKLKTFYSLMKRAGLKDKISFIVNRYDSQNALSVYDSQSAISVSDVTSILNMTNEDKEQFDSFKIPNDYKSLGKCWNYCELASEKARDSLFIKKLDSILRDKDFYNKDKNSSKSKGWFASIFKKGK